MSINNKITSTWNIIPRGVRLKVLSLLGIILLERYNLNWFNEPRTMVEKVKIIDNIIDVDFAIKLFTIDLIDKLKDADLFRIAYRSMWPASARWRIFETDNSLLVFKLEGITRALRRAIKKFDTNKPVFFITIPENLGSCTIESKTSLKFSRKSLSK